MMVSQNNLFLVPSRSPSLRFPAPPRKLQSPYIAFADEKKKTKKELSFYDCMRPVYISTRIFGLSPFVPIYDSSGNVLGARVRIFDAVWFVGAIAINLGLSFLMFMTIRPPDVTESSVLFISGQIFSIFNFIMIPLSIVLDMVNRNRLIASLRDLMAFDKNVRKYRFS